MRYYLLALLIGTSVGSTSAKEVNDGWLALFNGKDLNGWRASEHPGSFRVENGEIVARGERSHLFYVGDVEGADFKNFELRCEVMLEPGANSGVFFHTEYFEEGSPAKGYEAQLNNTQQDRRKTGGLFGIADVMDDSPVEDNVWFTQQLTVVGDRIVVKVNGNVTTDYTEPKDAGSDPKRRPGRVLSHGTLALQGHDPGSIVHFRKIEILPLADGPVATIPVPVEHPWWYERHAAKLAEKQGNEEKIQLVFIGDSITHAWDREWGEAMWAERFAPRGGLNLGYSGDRTEHVLWRLGLGAAGEENNEIGGLSPKLFVLMIGTNNTGHNQNLPEETAAGITAIVDRLHAVSPESQVLLLAIFPRGATMDDPLRLINTEINEQIATLDERERVTYLDISNVFLDGMGNLPKSVMPDLLHPEQDGYRLWADAIEEHVARLMGE